MHHGRIPVANAFLVLLIVAAVRARTMAPVALLRLLLSAPHSTLKAFFHLSASVSLSWSSPHLLPGVRDSRHQLLQPPYATALWQLPHLALHNVPSHVRRCVFVSCACVRTLIYASCACSRLWHACRRVRVRAREHSRRRGTHTKRALAPADSWASGVARGIFGQCTRAPWALFLPRCLSFSGSLARSICLLTHCATQRLGKRTLTWPSFS